MRFETVPCQKKSQKMALNSFIFFIVTFNVNAINARNYCDKIFIPYRPFPSKHWVGPGERSRFLCEPIINVKFISTSGMWGRAAPRLEMLLLRRNTIFVILEKFFVASYFWVKFAKSVKAVVEDFHQSHSHSCSGYSGFSLRIHLASSCSHQFPGHCSIKWPPLSGPLGLTLAGRLQRWRVCRQLYWEERGFLQRIIFNEIPLQLDCCSFRCSWYKNSPAAVKCLSLSRTHTVCISLYYFYRIHDMNTCNGLILQPFKNYSRVSKHCRF